MVKHAIFLRRMEEKSSELPLFGIIELKRFSCLSTKPFLASRKTFNASQGTIVKPYA